MTEDHLRLAAFTGLDAYELYALLKLRVDVFVVEQECAYPELDGLDLAPATRHLWLERTDEPIAYLRVLSDPGDGFRIGRVCVARAVRGEGLAGRLMDAALDLVGDRLCRLEAQSYLLAFYRRYGFMPVGPEYTLDGIAHTPMARPPRQR